MEFSEGILGAVYTCIDDKILLKLIEVYFRYINMFDYEYSKIKLYSMKCFSHIIESCLINLCCTFSFVNMSEYMKFRLCFLEILLNEFTALIIPFFGLIKNLEGWAMSNQNINICWYICPCFL